MEKIKKVLALLLVSCMVLGNVPGTVFAEGEHVHNEDCGYVAAVEGHECSHVCSVECLVCSHVHDENCGYAAAVEGQVCEHMCDETCMICAHTHDEKCGYVSAVEGHPCAVEISAQKVAGVQAQLDALPSPEEVAQMNETQLEELNDTLIAINDAYEELTLEEQKQIEAVFVDTMTAMQQAMGLAAAYATDNSNNLTAYASDNAGTKVYEIDCTQNKDVDIMAGESVTINGVVITSLNGDLTYRREQGGFWDWWGYAKENSFQISTEKGETITHIEITGEATLLDGTEWTKTATGVTWTGSALSVNFGRGFESTKLTVTVTGGTPTHTHGSWDYTASGTTLTAECKATGTCTLPEHKVSLTLSASDANYSGSAYSGASFGESSAWTGAGLTVPEITYEAKEGSQLTDGKAVEVGSYTAKATVGGVTAAADFTINPTTVSVTGVTLDKEVASMTVGGDTLTLVASVLPENATNKNVTWESNNTAAATVADGVVTAVAAGEATITVKTEDGEFTASCVVTVTEHVHNFTENGKYSWINVGNGFTLRYEVVCEKCGTVEDKTAGVTKTSSEGKTTYTATTAEGNVYTKKVIETITVTYDDEPYDYEYLQVVTLTSDVAVDWYADGVQVATAAKQYAFAATKNVTITTKEATAPKPVVTISANDRVWDTASSKYVFSFTTTWSVPEGYTFVKGGFIYRYGAANYGQIDRDTVFAKGTTVNSSLKVKYGTFDYTLKMSSSYATRDIFGIGYVVVKDKNGNEQTIYSENMAINLANR